MALFKFTKAMLEGKSIDVYNYGKMKRDFTYIDDIVEAIVRMQDIIPQPNPEWTVETGSPADSSAPYRVYNIGNSSPVELMDYITALEEALGMVAEKNMMPIQRAMCLRPARIQSRCMIWWDSDRKQRSVRGEELR